MAAGSGTPRNTLPADFVRAAVISPLEADRPRARAQCAGDQIERRALARAVRTDEAENLALTNLERHLIDRQESSETLGQALDREHFQRMA